jgi:hypothetical protein
MQCSQRVNRILDILDSDSIGDDEMEMVAAGKHVRCAVLLSRRARMALRYPNYSPANERIVCDWIERHLPADMTMGVRHKVMPLAIKMTFIKSHHELRAEHHFEWLQPMSEHV